MIAVIALGISLFIRRSIPYQGREELLTTTISIDSVWSLGPAATIYDKSADKYYWMKSYTSVDQSALDTLRFKKGKITYMKFLKGPLENRVYRLEVDSIVVFDQLVETGR